MSAHGNEHYQLFVCKGIVDADQELLVKMSILFKEELSKEGSAILELHKITPEHRLVVSYRGQAFQHDHQGLFFFWRGSPDFSLKILPPHDHFYPLGQEGIQYNSYQGTFDEIMIHCQGHQVADFSIKDFDQVKWIEQLTKSLRQYIE